MTHFSKQILNSARIAITGNIPGAHAHKGKHMQGVDSIPDSSVAVSYEAESMVDTLVRTQEGGDSLAALAHEARNMGTALGLYCELLEQPGVLAPAFQHFARELKMVAAANRRLVERLSLLQSNSPESNRQPDLFRESHPFHEPDSFCEPGPFLKPDPARHSGSSSLRTGSSRPPSPAQVEHATVGRWALLPAVPIQDLAAELRSNRNLLAALAGPLIQLSVEIRGGALPVRLTGEDLTRILVNLVKNSVEAMSSGGRIRVALGEVAMPGTAGRFLELRLEDAGSGIAPALLEAIFEPGCTTRSSSSSGHREHRGVGLAVTRSIVESAGGTIAALNGDPTGATFRILLPVPKC